MPFNKGDFTQQGVAGHVNANIRLNEKRLVNIDLTSNEEAEGCTINGAVTDLLNNEVYPIGAGVSGNIEITENGENINVAPYATATVNVAGGGGGDTPVCCTVTIVDSDNTGNPITFEEAALLTTNYQVVSIITSYPATLYAFYSDAEGYDSIVDLNKWQPNEYFSADNFADLVNCELATETEDGVFWHIDVLDKTLPSSITIDCKAFMEGSE